MRSKLVAVLLVLFALRPVSAQPFSILYHESLDTPNVTANVKALDVSPASLTRSLSFEAFGKRFDVTLERNQRLAAVGAPGEGVGIELYRGELTGQPATWARINRTGTDLSGAIFDGTELYIIAPYDAVSRALAAPMPTDGRTIIYRWSDVSGAFADEGGPHPGSARRQAAAFLESAAAAVLASPKQLTVGFVADFEFMPFASEAVKQSRLLAAVNVLDGIFGNQVGVFIEPQTETFTTSADPFTATEPLALLTELEDHKFNTPALRTLGLAHLFTGRDLSGSGSGGNGIVGIANRGAVCEERFGVGITQATFDDATNALIAAHEIAHNLGAPHDAESGSACSASPPGFLMESNINGTSTLSQCSLDEIARTLAAKACLTSLPPSDVSLTFGTEPTPSVVTSFDADIVVSVPAGAAAQGVSLVVEVSGGELTRINASTSTGWTCEKTGPSELSAVCRNASLRPGSSEHILVTLTGTAAAVSLHAAVASLNDGNSANNVLDRVFSLAPAADLVATVTPNFIESHLGEERTVTITIGNQRYNTAVDVTARLSFQYSYDVLEVASSAGPCPLPVPGTFDTNCSVGSIPVGGSQTIRVRFKLHDTLEGTNGWDAAGLGVEVSSAITHEVALADNFAAVTVVSAERFVDIAASIDGPTTVPVETAGRYTVTVANNGPETATDVQFSFNYSSFDVVPSIESLAGAGICEIDGYPLSRVFCQVPTLTAGQAFVLAASLRPTANGTFTLTAGTYRHEWDRQGANDTAQLVFGTVVAPPTPSPPTAPPPPSPPASPPASGGGGGLLGVLELAALLAAAWARRRPRRAMQRSVAGTAAAPPRLVERIARG